MKWWKKGVKGRIYWQGFIRNKREKVAARERNKNLKREKKKVGNLGIIVRAWLLWPCLFPWFCCSLSMFPGFDASLGTFLLFFKGLVSSWPPLFLEIIYYGFQHFAKNLKQWWPFQLAVDVHDYASFSTVFLPALRRSWFVFFFFFC